MFTNGYELIQFLMYTNPLMTTKYVFIYYALFNRSSKSGFQSKLKTMLYVLYVVDVYDDIQGHTLLRLKDISSAREGLAINYLTISKKAIK